MLHLFLVILKFGQVNISWEALFPAGTININFYKIYVLIESLAKRICRCNEIELMLQIHVVLMKRS